MAATPPRRSPRLGFVVLALLVLVAAFVWFARGDRTPEQAPTGVQASSSEPEPAPPPSARLGALDTPTTAERSAVDTPIPVVDATDEPRPPDAAPAPEVADLAARDFLELRVVDELQAPIFDASVTIHGLRKEGDKGSWYSRRDDASPVHTDRDGRARLPYERWTDIDGKTVEVDLIVEHPDFISFRDSSYALSPGEHVITLKQGSMVWVTAWHGSRDRVVADIALQTEWQAQLGQDGWRREADGRWSTTRLAPGLHHITVTHASAELGSLASDFTSFELGEHARVDLELELKPPVTLRGRLDDVVPRPIVGGHVRLNLHTSRDHQGLSSNHEAVVAPDGTFELPGLRRASGQIIALCDGWVSKQVPPRTFDESRTRVGPTVSAAERAEIFARVQAEERWPQPVDASDAQSFVVEMEATAELEVRVVDEQGAELAGVTVNASPNVFWRGVGSIIFPWNEWKATTDEHGLARIGNLPPDDSLWIGATSTTHQMLKADRDRNPSVVLESGKTTRYELVLEKIP